MGRECPRLWEVDAYRERRLGAKDAASFERHAGTCASCSARLDGDERLRRLARALPDDAPTELALRRTRAKVLRDLATGVVPSRRTGRVAAGLVAVAVVVGLGAWLLVPRGNEAREAAVSVAPATAPSTVADATREPFAGAVAALAESRWTQSRAAGIERVTLESGWVRIHVRPQRAGERFLVVLPDGELEVRGTTFEITVEGSATKDVHVDDGVVELRLADDAPRRLGAGDMWRATPSTPPATVAMASSLAPAARGASSPRTAPERVGSTEYTAAVQLLLQGRNAEASAAFEAFVLAHPGAQQVEDATYLDAVALARAGRTDAAALAAEQHLRRFPGSFHRKEAATVVALAASLRGDCPRARSVVAEWTRGAPDADVRAALRGCEEK
jgi:hypothetical protein